MDKKEISISENEYSFKMKDNKEITLKAICKTTYKSLEKNNNDEPFCQISDSSEKNTSDNNNNPTTSKEILNKSNKTKSNSTDDTKLNNPSFNQISLELDNLLLETNSYSIKCKNKDFNVSSKITVLELSQELFLKDFRELLNENNNFSDNESLSFILKEYLDNFIKETNSNKQIRREVSVDLLSEFSNLSTLELLIKQEIKLLDNKFNINSQGVVEKELKIKTFYIIEEEDYSKATFILSLLDKNNSNNGSGIDSSVGNIIDNTKTSDNNVKKEFGLVVFISDNEKEANEAYIDEKVAKKIVLN